MFRKVAMKVSITTMIVNIILSIMKLLAGIFSNSNVLVSDAVHSGADVLCTVVVIMGVWFASKESDKEHPYGHERLECVAAIILSEFLFITGLELGVNAVKDILQGSYGNGEEPGIMALGVAIVSIVIKEGMFWYTKSNARKIESSALMADAWHHRSDAIATTGALVGMIGAKLGFPIMDSVASIFILGFIEKTAYQIFKDAIYKMVDHSCDDETEEEMKRCILMDESVLRVDSFHTRVFGNKIYVEIEIGVDSTCTLQEAHDIAKRVHDNIEVEFLKVKHISVHVNPVK